MKAVTTTLKSVYVCRYCGFVSTLGGEFRVEQGIRVCVDCKADYGKDEDVTQWINAAVQADVNYGEFFKN